MKARVVHCRKAFTSMFPAGSVMVEARRRADGVICAHGKTDG